MLDTWGMPLLVITILIFMGWFAIGTQWNVRKGDAVNKWLRLGLPLIGERTTYRWLGSSVMELKIAKANAPFRSAETLVVFEPRDVVFLLAWARWRGRRDLLIFRAQLRDAPRFEIEVFDPQGWTTHHTERDVQKKNWTRWELPADQPLHAYYTGDAGAVIARLIDLASHAGAQLVRVSVHRNVPNLELHWRLPEVANHPARDLFSQVRQIAEQVIRA